MTAWSVCEAEGLGYVGLFIPGRGGGAPRDIQIDDTPSVIIAGVVRVLIKRLIGVQEKKR